MIFYIYKEKEPPCSLIMTFLFNILALFLVLLVVRSLESPSLKMIAGFTMAVVMQHLVNRFYFIPLAKKNDSGFFGFFSFLSAKRNQYYLYFSMSCIFLMLLISQNIKNDLEIVKTIIGCFFLNQLVFYVAVKYYDMLFKEKADKDEISGIDYSYLVSHEAGHALVYAALGMLPQDILLVANKNPKHTGYAGFVTKVKTNRKVIERSFLEWEMLVALAGQKGEEIILGQSTMGCANDYADWLERAREYGQEGCLGVYYCDPKTHLEMEWNERKLLELKQQQLALLQNFFELNYTVFNELIESLSKTERLGQKELNPLMKRVVFPDGFPMPFGEFERYSDTWDKARVV